MSRVENSGVSGTLVYMSPEQIRGKDVGKVADIYSFGTIVWEWCEDRKGNYTSGLVPEP